MMLYRGAEVQTSCCHPFCQLPVVCTQVLDASLTHTHTSQHRFHPFQCCGGIAEMLQPSSRACICAAMHQMVLSMQPMLDAQQAMILLNQSCLWISCLISGLVCRYVYLIDGTGHVRWRASGPPSAADTALMLQSARQLFNEPTFQGHS